MILQKQILTQIFFSHPGPIIGLPGKIILDDFS